MNANSPSDRIHRLLDIVVEEVSLVDRAANKQRFLIVKRSDAMNNTPEPTLSANSGEENGIENLDAARDSSVSDAASANAQTNNKEEPTAADMEDASALQQVAVSALTHLTEAVELLGNTEDESAKTRIADLAGELRSVAEQLAGTPQESVSQEGKPGDKGEDIESMIASLKAAVERFNAAMTSKDSIAGPAKTDEGNNKSRSLVDEIKGLAQALKEHQQRLIKLEKRFGMPSSVPVGENKHEPEEVGWPLDMNRLCDRENVDKSVSFHDV